jgi:hypothetical protein
MHARIPAFTRVLAALLAASQFGPHSIAQEFKPDPLPSWNEGAAKSAIVDFIGRVTAEKSASYVAPESRIATFDTTARCGPSGRFLSRLLSPSIG